MRNKGLETCVRAASNRGFLYATLSRARPLRFTTAQHPLPLMEAPVVNLAAGSGELPPAARGIAQPVLFGVFTLSGISALLYQLVWQRSLLTLYGSNVESVAMVVTAFMMGLGLGSLAGGWVSERARIPLVLLFAAAELGIAVYGLISVRLFHLVAEVTVGAGTLATGVLAFALVFLPTLLMGSTLPLLVAHQVRRTGSVGQSVSWLYFVNTLGAALGAFLAAFVFLGRFGQAGSVRLAALINAVAAATILVAWVAKRK